MSWKIEEIDRRKFMAAAGTASVLGALGAGSTASAAPGAYVIPEQFQPRAVRIQPGFKVGTIHVFTEYHFLYYITEERQAIRYGVGVGEQGRQFSGTATVGRKAEWPSWTPTANMIARQPELYEKYAAGMPGGPENPLGARALYLYRNGRDTMYRIHGTTAPYSIGQSVSNGCIRMVNAHVEDLYTRVPVGTRVYVT